MEMNPLNDACSSGILEGSNSFHVSTLIERFDVESPPLGTACAWFCALHVRY